MEALGKGAELSDDEIIGLTDKIKKYLPTIEKKQIESAITTADDPMDLKRLSEKIRKMRQAGLDKGGEFSVENLVFKVLRNMKYLDKLSKAFHQQQDDELSLK